MVGTSYVFPCPVGGTVVGWMKYYNLDGSQNGIFKFRTPQSTRPGIQCTLRSAFNNLFPSPSINKGQFTLGLYYYANTLTFTALS
nr:YolA family protein [Pectobacterium sp. PL152]